MVLSDEAQKSVDDSVDAGVQEINYTQYKEQVNKPIVKVHLPSFASNVSKAANATKGVKQGAVSDQLTDTADRLEYVHTTVVKPTQEQAVKLGQLTSNLANTGTVIMGSVQGIRTGLSEARDFLENEALSIAAEGVLKHWNTIFGHVDSLLAYVIHQVRFEVGRCGVVSNMYRGFTGSICHHYAAGMNASWVAFGLSALFLLISIILCMRASKHFLRVSFRAESDEQAEEEMVELPWMDEAHRRK